MESLYTVKEIARLLNIKANTVRAWLRSGKLHGIRSGKNQKWRVPQSEIERVIRSNDYKD